MATVTIRISQQTHQLLRQLAEKRGRSIGDVVDEAARKLEDADFWDELNASYDRLRADPMASAEYDAEVAALDAASLADFDEPPYEGIEELLAETETAASICEPRLPAYEGLDELLSPRRGRAGAKA